MTFVPKMTSNFWLHCAISPLKISKNILQHFIFFVKIKLVSTVWVSMSLSKSGYSERPQRPRDPNVQNYFSRVHIVGYYVCVSLFFTFFLVCRTLLPVHNFLRFWPTWLPFWRWKSMDFGECNKLWKLGLGHNATM